MEITFHSHHAVISDRMHRRAERAIRKLAARLPRAVDATVLFEQDGPERRVEIVLRRARLGSLIGKGLAAKSGPALTQALAKLEAQIARRKRTVKARARAVSRI